MLHFLCSCNLIQYTFVCSEPRLHRRPASELPKPLGLGFASAQRMLLARRLLLRATMTSKPPGGSSGAQKRLESVVTSLNIKPGPELLGRLNVGDLSLPIYECTTPARLPRESSRALLNYKTSPEIIDHLSWMLQKHTLGQSHSPHLSRNLRLSVSQSADM